MNDQRREEFDHGEKTDPENNFLYQKAVGDDTVGSIGEAICKIEPGKHSYNQPEDKRKIVDWLGLEAYLKDKPEDSDGSSGLNKSP